MRVLVLNPGSSSLKFSVFDGATSILDGESTTIANPHDALREVIEASANITAIEAVGYRVVHPGPTRDRHQRVTPAVLEALEAATPFAPLHDPGVIAIIREGMRLFPHLPHYVCFDTVFHQTMPAEATTYPIPKNLRDQGVRRYGFHGLSCESIVRQLDPIPARMVIAHLGSGCSLTALRDGRSVDTSMGLTPTGGIPMGTRPGDLDPGLVLYLLRRETGSREAALTLVESTLNHQSGMVALSGLPNDMKQVRKAASDADPQATLALKVFTRAIAKTIGSYAFLLGGLDTIVFTGGIGQHDPVTRAESLAGLESFGIALDPAANRDNSQGVHSIHASNSVTALLVAPAQEDLVIANHVSRMAAAGE